MSRKSLAMEIFQNERIDEFEQIISSARRKGYSMISLERAKKILKSGADLPSSVIVLRHDIDHCTPATIEMAKIEKKHGATASFYFRKKTFDIKLIAELLESGHECSLHFETVADFFIKNMVYPSKKKLTPEFIQSCKEQLSEDIQKFEKKCSDGGLRVKIQTIAAHGHKINRMLGYPNNLLLLPGQPGSEAFSHILEAYNPNFLLNFDIYISDCPVNLNRGFTYGIHPMEAISKGGNRILLLTHPEHWKVAKHKIWMRAMWALLYGEKIKSYSSPLDTEVA